MIIFKLFVKNFLVVCLTFSTAQASLLVGRVIGITDGDTITVLDSEKREHKIRLMGIDAPEKKQSYGPNYLNTESSTGPTEYINFI